MSRRDEPFAMFMGTYFLGLGVGITVFVLDSGVLRAIVGLGGLIACSAVAEAAAKRPE